MPTLHQNLRSTQLQRFFNFPVHLLKGDHVGIRILFGAVKGAKFAINVADVRVVDVAVDDVGDDLLATPFVRLALRQVAAEIGQLAELVERQRV